MTTLETTYPHIAITYTSGDVTTAPVAARQGESAVTAFDRFLARVKREHQSYERNGAVRFTLHLSPTYSQSARLATLRPE